MRPMCLRAIIAAGGLPIILPLGLSGKDLAHLAARCDAFLFCGGPDVHPFHFHEETHIHSGNVSAKRDELELSLLPFAIAAEKPILGICRGVQLINICLGGDIWQDIPSQYSSDFPLAHAQPFGYEIPSHTVTVTPGSLLEDIIRNQTRRTPERPEPAARGHGGAGKSHLRLAVNSMHHQAVRRLAPGLTAAASAPDGIIEAIEYPDYPTFFLGVQWHPEYLWPGDEAAMGVFRRFVEAAG